MLCSLNEYTIIPSRTTNVRHRSECNPYYENQRLPIFTAPMSSVINLDNYKKFEDAGVNTIIPRNVNKSLRFNQCTKTFCAFSLSETKELFLMTSAEAQKRMDNNNTYYICIDLANGHMTSLLDLCKKLKHLYGDHIVIMTGNIANPYTYIEYAKVGIDYVRVGIGGGSACTTSVNGGVHYPMGSLLAELRLRKDSLEFTNVAHRPKIVADGGFSNYDQIIKALALGADYVMLGSMLASTEEACGEENHIFRNPNDWSKEEKKYLTWNEEARCFYLRMREYYGMSTKTAQIELGGKGDKVSEGINTMVYIKYPLDVWIKRFISYLRSAMSYSNTTTLDDFKRKADCRVMSINSYLAYQK